MNYLNKPGFRYSSGDLGSSSHGEERPAPKCMPETWTCMSTGMLALKPNPRELRMLNNWKLNMGGQRVLILRVEFQMWRSSRENCPQTCNLNIGWWEWRHFSTNTGRTKTISTILTFFIEIIDERKRLLKFPEVMISDKSFVNLRNGPFSPLHPYTHRTQRLVWVPWCDSRSRKNGGRVPPVV